MADVGALAAGTPAGADGEFSFAGGALGALATLSVAGGAVIAASVPTSIFRSIGVFVPEAKSISLFAGANPICDISTRKWPAGRAGNSNFPLSSVQVIHAVPVEVWMTRNVAPGTAVPSGARTVPANCESAGVSASGLSCAASGTPTVVNDTTSHASSAASLLPNNVHAPSSP